ncbi:Two-component system sensor histidine kinase [hydrothermal vent metagenome]|uniref:histidine kinase n=1 Tax=hydrothermal vent metagenome TaxID=652676 RepID=A0A3B0T2G3_9ZZZZ
MADPLPERVKAFAGRFSVRTKIIGIVLALTTILGLGVTWQARSAMSGLATSELVSRGQAIALEVAEQVVTPMAANDIPAVTSILDALLTSHPDTVFVVVARADGVIVGIATDTNEYPPGTIGSNLTDVPAAVDGLHVFSATVKNTGGAVRVGVSDTRVGNTVNAVTLQLLLTTLFVGAIGIVAATLLTWLLTRPIVDLVKTTTKVSEGDLTARATVAAEDEIGALAESFNGMVDEIEISRATIAETEQMRTRLLERLIAAQEDERKRIARELHDGIGQSLTSIMLAAGLLDRSESVDERNEYTARIREASADTLKQVRRLGRELRPSVLDDLGLSAALDRYVAEFRLRCPEITAEIHYHLPARLEPLIETTLYRVVQEAMTNVARHSGARTVSVLIGLRSGLVRAIIEDDGAGFDPEVKRASGESVGIHGMVERIELLGGRLDIESSEHGTTIYAEVPMPETANGTA